jgi:tRNA (cmo5U34)-methyltransferase
MNGRIMSSGRDRVYAELKSDIEGFLFDSKVTAVFADMIRRSVPGYGAAVAMSGVIAARYAQDDSNIYDLGCSLGATTASIQQYLQAQRCTIVAVDSSQTMIDSCCGEFDCRDADVVQFVCDDIRDIDITRASVVALNFTLQFIPPGERLELLQKIHTGMLPGGILVLSEKLAFDQQQQQLFTDLHHAFKQANGYSELEISQKRTALENVLLPETMEQHRQRLQQAGFAVVYCWFQCLNFASMIAFKSSLPPDTADNES